MVKLPPNFSLYAKVPQLQLPTPKLLPLKAIQAAVVQNNTPNEVKPDEVKLATQTASKQSIPRLSLVDADQVLSPTDSVQAAIDNAKPGDTLQLKAGTYHLDDLRIQNKKDLTLVGEPGTKIVGNIQINRSHDISIENIHVEGSKIRSFKEPKPTDMNVPEMFVTDSTQITLNKMTFNHLNGHGKTGNSVRSMLEIGPKSQDVTVKDSQFFSETPDFSPAPKDKRLMVNGLRSQGKNTRIEGNSFKNVGIGIQSGGLGAIVSKNQIHNFSQDGIQVYGHNTQIVGNEISDLIYLDALGNGDKVAHHDAIQLWSPEPTDDRDGRYKGKYALKNVTIEGNTIKSTTDANRDLQGVLQGIAAFDGYMDGLSIKHNNIQTHSTKHGITINAPRASTTRDFEISHNTVENQFVARPLGKLKPTLNLNVLRFKNNPRSKTEAWTWRKTDNYAVKLQNNTLNTPANIQPEIRTH